ncbi:MAG: hypothetical protein J6M94_04890 [Prevotella sp.]|nr:hypothetical protein [Prevotella sp.]
MKDKRKTTFSFFYFYLFAYPEKVKRRAASGNANAVGSIYCTLKGRKSLNNNKHPPGATWL